MRDDKYIGKGYYYYYYPLTSIISSALDLTLTFMLINAKITLLVNRIVGSWLHKYVELLEDEMNTTRVVRERIGLED
jgi:hypothetical protein